MANQYGKNFEPHTCKVCKKQKPRSCFSYVDRKLGAKSGYRETCKECSAERAEKEREKRKNNWKYHPTRHMLNNSKQRAKVAGLEHTLTIDDIVIPDFCPVLGIKLETGNRKEHHNAPSIDRIDNEKGYTKDNILVVSTRANLIKKDATIDELIMIGNFYSEFKEKQK